MAWVPVESVFAKSWSLLQRNWLIAVPGIAGALLNALLWSLMTHSQSGFFFDGVAIFTLLSMLIFNVTAAMMTGMAAAVWRGGSCTIDDALRVFSGGKAATLAASIAAIIGVILVASFLSVFTLGVSLLAAIFFLIYTYAAAIIGGYPGTAALQESYRVAKMRASGTAVMLGAMVMTALVIAIAAVLIGGPFGLGAVIGSLVAQVTLAFFALVVTGEYINLRGS